MFDVGEIVYPNLTLTEDERKNGLKIFFELIPNPGFQYSRDAKNVEYFYLGEFAVVIEQPKPYASSWSSTFLPETWCKIITSSGKIGYIRTNSIRSVG